MITVGHKIEIKPNNKQKTHFRKAFGCARLAWNWGLAEWQRQYKEGERPTAFALIKKFNSIKKESYPYVMEVSKYVVQHPFLDLREAYSSFFKHEKKYPKFKKKKDGMGSFYIGGDQVRLSHTNQNSKAFKKLQHNVSQKHQYLNIPKLGWVKMTECLRFNGKINSVTISSEHGSFYASFSVQVTEEEYQRTHRHTTEKKNDSVGIDLGLKHSLILSCGVAIDNPKPLHKHQRRISRLQRQLSKRVHARTKQERLQHVASSNNYRKLSRKVSKANGKVADIRRDFVHKVTTILTTRFREIGMEDLNTKGMMQNHRLARSVADTSFYEIRRQIEYKSAYNGVKITKADRFYPSSKTCSQCGNVKKVLKLSERVYRCECCGAVLDRDYNAALNLRSLCNHNSVGRGSPEFTPVDLTALLSIFTLNRIATSKVEAGR